MLNRLIEFNFISSRAGQRFWKEWVTFARKSTQKVKTRTVQGVGKGANPTP